MAQVGSHPSHGMHPKHTSRRRTSTSHSHPVPAGLPHHRSAPQANAYLLQPTGFQEHRYGGILNDPREYEDLGVLPGMKPYSTLNNPNDLHFSGLPDDEIQDLINSKVFDDGAPPGNEQGSNNAPLSVRNDASRKPEAPKRNSRADPPRAQRRGHRPSLRNSSDGIFNDPDEYDLTYPDTSHADPTKGHSSVHGASGKSPQSVRNNTSRQPDAARMNAQAGPSTGQGRVHNASAQYDVDLFLGHSEEDREAAYLSGEDLEEWVAKRWGRSENEQENQDSRTARHDTRRSEGSMSNAQADQSTTRGPVGNPSPQKTSNEIPKNHTTSPPQESKVTSHSNRHAFVRDATPSPPPKNNARFPHGYVKSTETGPQTRQASVRDASPEPLSTGSRSPHKHVKFAETTPPDRRTTVRDATPSPPPTNDARFPHGSAKSTETGPQTRRASPEDAPTGRPPAVGGSANNIESKTEIFLNSRPSAQWTTAQVVQNAAEATPSATPQLDKGKGKEQDIGDVLSSSRLHPVQGPPHPPPNVPTTRSAPDLAHQTPASDAQRVHWTRDENQDREFVSGGTGNRKEIKQDTPARSSNIIQQATRPMPARTSSPPQPSPLPASSTAQLRTLHDVLDLNLTKSSIERLYPLLEKVLTRKNNLVLQDLPSPQCCGSKLLIPHSFDKCCRTLEPGLVKTLSCFHRAKSISNAEWSVCPESWYETYLTRLDNIEALLGWVDRSFDRLDSLNGWSKNVVPPSLKSIAADLFCAGESLQHFVSQVHESFERLGLHYVHIQQGWGLSGQGS